MRFTLCVDIGAESFSPFAESGVVASFVELSGDGTVFSLDGGVVCCKSANSPRTTRTFPGASMPTRTARPLTFRMEIVMSSPMRMVS
jgi:hypothetical protein